LLLALLLLPEVALLVFFAAGAALASPAGLPHRADVVVVLGGGVARYPRGRDLVLAGYSDRLIVFEPNAAERYDALAQVPSVEFWDDVNPQNTWGEALAVRSWMQANGLHTALVVSDSPHLLRVAYSWSSHFRGTGLTYTPIAADPPWWSAWRWWAHPQSARFVEAEVLKLGYYVVRYRFGLF
jgi:uncharacterized SAM-binding protein YcdF (DUF218 family)